MKTLNLALAFLLELALLAALSFWGFHLGHSNVVHWFVGIGVPLMLAMIWSRIAAPMAGHRLGLIQLLIFKIVVFTIGSVALYMVEKKGVAIALEAISLANLALAFVWKQ